MSIDLTEAFILVCVCKIKPTANRKCFNFHPMNKIEKLIGNVNQSELSENSDADNYNFCMVYGMQS